LKYLIYNAAKWLLLEYSLNNSKEYLKGNPCKPVYDIIKPSA